MGEAIGVVQYVLGFHSGDMMATLNAYIAGALGLIVLYIVVYKASESTQVIQSLSAANNSAIRTLQGR